MLPYTEKTVFGDPYLRRLLVYRRKRIESLNQIGNRIKIQIADILREERSRIDASYTDYSRTSQAVVDRCRIDIESLYKRWERQLEEIEEVNSFISTILAGEGHRPERVSEMLKLSISDPTLSRYPDIALSPEWLDQFLKSV